MVPFRKHPRLLMDKFILVDKNPLLFSLNMMMIHGAKRSFCAFVITRRWKSLFHLLCFSTLELCSSLRKSIHFLSRSNFKHQCVSHCFILIIAWLRRRTPPTHQANSSISCLASNELHLELIDFLSFIMYCSFSRLNLFIRG